LEGIGYLEKLSSSNIRYVGNTEDPELSNELKYLRS
jgi:hypothetical protein